MPVYVKSGGTWRETSELYVRDGTSYTNKTILKNAGLVKLYDLACNNKIPK